MEITGISQGGKGKPEKVKKITKGQAGDSRFLTIILDCVKRRCEILGLDAPGEMRHSGSLQLNLTDEQRADRINTLLERARARRDERTGSADTGDVSGRSAPAADPRVPTSGTLASSSAPIPFPSDPIPAPTDFLAANGPVNSKK
jgi:hypothetical protein